MAGSNKVKNPYGYHFCQMRDPEVGDRYESFAERIARYRDMKHLSREAFAEECDMYARKYNTKVTKHDIRNYEYRGVSPKIDKLYAMHKVTGWPLEYLCGYKGNGTYYSTGMPAGIGPLSPNGRSGLVTRMRKAKVQINRTNA